MLMLLGRPAGSSARILAMSMLISGESNVIRVLGLGVLHVPESDPYIIQKFDPSNSSVCPRALTVPLC